MARSSRLERAALRVRALDAAAAATRDLARAGDDLLPQPRVATARRAVEATAVRSSGVLQRRAVVDEHGHDLVPVVHLGGGLRRPGAGRTTGSPAASATAVAGLHVADAQPGVGDRAREPLAQRVATLEVAEVGHEPADVRAGRRSAGTTASPVTAT